MIAPIFLAVKNNHFEVVEVLSKSKVHIDVMEPVHPRRSLIHVASNSGNSKILEFLLNRLDDQLAQSSKDELGNTPLHYAKTSDIVELLCNKGSSIEVENLAG